ncbi:MAG: squalene/phytoene synthase family protein [Candidatus Anstonellales archaeon]
MGSSEALNYCWSSLPNVSRSFALTIPYIDESIRDKVMLGYLEARILDTIEDSDIEKGMKLRLMDLWLSVLAVERWNDNVVRAIEKNLDELSCVCKFIGNEYYKGLMQNAKKVIEVHKEMGAGFWKICYRWFNEMKEGMKEFLSRRIETFEDLDRYTYYVAGTVGGFLTDLVALEIKDSSVVERLKEDAEDVGMFLQKVNVIRDYRVDTLEGRHFWPAKLLGNYSYDDLLKEENMRDSLRILSAMVKEARRHVQRCERYISSIPERLKGYRSFVAINYLMALRTLEKVEGNPALFLSQEPVKIGRDEVSRIIKEVTKS